ncbi:hypothetical protein [Nitrosomonas communis]|uniref:Uncharacterized protein n=1 Tax=Nitrosomonas communis TaxID=44574 RepID=A0A1I4U948_9PROT|nr:hypothetical protein [Nitrosomonas communis]SFM85492.1 hypothetical protein SAMN05421863_106119 [Nitrosomonas communis]
MKKTTLLINVFAIALVHLLVLPGLVAANEKGSGTFKFQYAVKFVCGANLTRTSLEHNLFLPGSYATVVNIHNPNEQNVKFRKKIALVNQFAPQQPGPVSPFTEGELIAEHALGVGCEQINDSEITPLPIHGRVDGFLVIESTESLDVTAVYTAGGPAGTTEASDNGIVRVESIAVEQIKERKISR